MSTINFEKSPAIYCKIRARHRPTVMWALSNAPNLQSRNVIDCGADDCLMGEIGIEWLRPETPVWRYMDYDRVIEMIKGEEIHFHRSDSFSDPLEGSVPRAVRDMSDKTYDEVAEDNDNAKETLRSAFERIRKITFLNCWHLNTGESMAMWRLYGKSNKTVAIKSTVEKLSRAIEEPSGGVTVIAPVFYADYDSSYEDLDRASREAVDIVFSADRAPTMHDLYQMKESSFRHESEVRIIYQGMEAITEPTDEEDDNAGWRGDLPFETKEETGRVAKPFRLHLQ